MSSNDMRKIMNLLNEARQTDNPDVEYTETGSTKAKTAAKEFSKITAEVSGVTSAKFTRLAKKFKEIDDLNKRIQELRDRANQEAKDSIDEFFNAEDEVYTRYVDTVSLSITMSKAIEEETVQVSETNIQNFVEELYELVDGDLKPMIESLLEKHTKVQTKVRAAQQGRVTVKLPAKKESVNEAGVGSMLSGFIKSIVHFVDRFVRGYDRKLANIAQRYGLS